MSAALLVRSGGGLRARVLAAMLALALILGGPSVGAAQVVPPGPLVRVPPARDRADTVRRAPRDTATRAPGDSTDQRALVEWVADDSVMRALLDRTGMTGTRYQADEVVFESRGRSIILNGNAAVQRNESIIVSDTILYSDSSKIVIALGDTAILRDPAQGPADVIALGRIAYDIQNRRGVVTNVSTSVESGETWFLNAKRSYFQGDSTSAAEQRFYARNGTLTSCSDTEYPDYYFKAKEIKLVQKRILVARPAILFIEDIPVAWLPFIFQDLRSGRRSGILPPRIGISDIVRNSPTYQRRIENLGYYWAISDYMDARAWIDWRSGSRDGFGAMDYNGNLNYRWLDRFLSGSIGLRQLNSGLGNTSGITWFHSQQFSQQTNFNANISYATNASAARRNDTNPYAALATIHSSAAFNTTVGPARVALGGDRNEATNSGIRMTLPSLNVTTGTLNLAPWLAWTPTLSIQNNLQSRIEQGRFVLRGDRLDSARTRGSGRNTTFALGTPFVIRDFSLSLNVSGRDLESNFPDSVLVRSGGDSAYRVFAKTFESGIDWSVGFGLPRFSQGRFNVSPSVNIVNVASGEFFLRNQLTGGHFIHQSKRLQYSVSASPTFFGLFPGIGGFSRFRHALSPTISYAFAPNARVSDAFLIAQGRVPGRDLGSLRQNSISLGLSTNIEAKARSANADSASNDEGTKLKLLSVNFDGLGYNFEQVRFLREEGRSNGQAVKWTAGLTTDSWGYRLASDLVPNASFSTRYSLFAGDIRSDTARFAPFLTSVEASFQLNRQSSIFAALTRVFGRPIRNENPILEKPRPGGDDVYAQQIAAQPFAGNTSRRSEYAMPDTRNGWNASFTFSSSRNRRIAGANVIDPRDQCRLYPDPIIRDQCIIASSTQNPDTAFRTSASRSFDVGPDRTNLNASTSFGITEKWAAQWSTNYDFEEGQFGSQIVSLRRELHDWDAVFGFTKGPTGAFSFTAFISLRAQPELKFDYRRSEYR